MYDVSLLMIYNTDSTRSHLRGEVCAIDQPASKFATWTGVEYISDSPIKSPRGVKLHVINIPDTINISKILHPGESNNKLIRRGVTVQLNRIDQNLISSITGISKEGTIPWNRFKTFLRNQNKNRDFTDADIEVKSTDFNTNLLTAAIRKSS